MSTTEFKDRPAFPCRDSIVVDGETEDYLGLTIEDFITIMVLSQAGADSRWNHDECIERILKAIE